MNVSIQTADVFIRGKNVPLTEKVARQLPRTETGGRKDQYALIGTVVLGREEHVLIQSPAGLTKLERSNYLGMGAPLGSPTTAPRLILL